MRLFASFTALIAFASSTDERDCSEWKQCLNIQFPTTNDDLLQSIGCHGASSCVASKISSNADVNCNGFDSCSTSTLFASSGDIYCNGPGSCLGSEPIEADDGTVYCSGDTACFKTHVSTNGGNKIVCDGFNGCADSKLSAQASITECSGNGACTQSHLLDTNNMATCNGNWGCYLSQLEIGDDGEVRCYGSHSCHQADIHSTYIKGYGEYSLNGATINSEYLNTEVTVEAYGYFAGQDAQFVCHCGKTCTLDCAGNGCLDMQFTCQRGSKCSYFCDEEHGISCPTVNDHSTGTLETQCNDDEEDEDDVEQEMQQVDSDTHKDYTSAGHGDSKEEADKDDEVDDSVLLCRGKQECVVDANDNQISKEDGEIQCSGYQACYSSTVFAADTVTCSGCKACSQCMSVSTDASAGGNTLCSGHEACASSDEVTAGGDVLCSGPDSCAEVENLWVSGENKIQCDGPTACSDAVLTAEYGDIECNGRNSCADSKVNMKATLWCNGHKSCTQASVKTKDGTVECHGTDSCKQAKLSAKKVTAYGYEALAKATIDSTDISEMTVEVFGYDAGSGATLNCQAGSVCSLVCMNNGCEGLAFNCYQDATCSYECDEDQNIACPEFKQYSARKKKVVMGDVIVNGEQEAQTRAINTLYNNDLMISVFVIGAFVLVLLALCYSQYSKYAEYKEYEPLY